MNFPLSPEIISAVLGPYGPLEKVRANWPLVEAGLDAAEIYSPLCAVAAISTIAAESGSFSPMKKSGGPAYLANLYAKFYGRGFIQITGRRDYGHFGREIGQDLIENPDAALDPRIAAGILAVYFKERNVRVLADQQNWEMVRRRVRPALTEWPRFIDVVTKLLSALNNPLPASPVAISHEAIDD
jgi:hypothetical protein